MKVILRSSSFWLLSIISGTFSCLFFGLESCRPLEEKQKVENGIPIDCTYSLPNLARVNQFIMENPEDGKLFRIRSQILLDSGQYKKALSDAKRALSLNPEDLYNFVVVGKAHRALGQIDSALMACNTAEKTGFEDADNFLLMGDLYFIVRQYNKSLDYLNRALKLAPYEPKIYFLKGLLFWEQKDTTKAISNWQTSIEQDAGFGDGHAKLASYYMDKKRYTTAEQYLRSGLRLKPNDAILNYDMGVFLSNKGYTDSAALSYEKALSINPNLSQAQANLGMVRFNQRKYEEAKILLEKALPADPKNSVMAYTLGLSYQYVGNLENAETELIKVMKLDREYTKEAAKSLEKVRKLMQEQKRDSVRIQTQ